jgi:adenylate kinase
MDAGELVPDTVILGLVRTALAAPAAGKGAILDGFPRNVAQAEALSGILAEQGRSVDAVVALEVPNEAIVTRMSGRRTDPVTGEVYHVVHNPPPAEVAGRVVQRQDDREETIRHRLEVYEASTRPLIEYYEREGVPVRRVDGDRPIDVVREDLLKVVKA